MPCPGLASLYRPDQFALQHPQHGLQVMPALEHLTIHANNRNFGRFSIR